MPTNDEIRARLNARTDPRYMTFCEIGDGWLPIVDELDTAIAALYPDYVIHQIKEKFGGLRYYCDVEYDEQVRPLIRQAEIRADATCEICGQPASLDESKYWFKTLCPTHKKERLE